MTPLAKTLVASAALLAFAFGALALSRGRSAESSERGDTAPGPSESPLPASARASERPGPEANARTLVPKNAWLIVDFDTSLSERRPFEDAKEVKCRSVTSPPRAALGVLPPKDPEGDPSIVLAAPRVSPEFFACARERILGSGGAEAPLAPGLDLLKSPSGLLIHEQATGSLVFASGNPNLELLMKTLFGLPTGLSSSNEADHAANPSPTLAYATFALPKDWLGQAGDDARVSPLRYAQGGTASLLPGGSLTATLSCDPVGCGVLRKFAERALGDLSRAQGWDLSEAKWSEQPGKIALRLNMRMALPRALKGLRLPSLSSQ